jgi:hypothetical protein
MKRSHDVSGSTADHRFPSGNGDSWKIRRHIGTIEGLELACGWGGGPSMSLPDSKTMCATHRVIAAVRLGEVVSGMLSAASWRQRIMLETGGCCAVGTDA